VLPASFAIPYLLFAPLPPSIAIAIIPVADAACRPGAQACFATVRIEARNRSNRTLYLKSLYVVFSERSSFVDNFNPPLEVAAFGAVRMPRLFELHAEAIHDLRVRYTAQGDRTTMRRESVTSGSLRGLKEAAQAACMRCNGGREELCNCESGDGGRRCTEVTQCRGVCLFDRIEALSDPLCTSSPMKGCPTPITSGFRVGHCSELIVPFGCFDVLTPADSEKRPISLLSGRSRTCAPAATLVR
jgi:hypothetical protein